MNIKQVKYTFVISFIIAAVTLINFIPNSSNIVGPFDIKNRPVSLISQKYVYDWGNVLTNIDEYSENYISENIVKKYGIEVVIVTLPNLQGHLSVENAAFKIFNNWKIGKKYNGKGILLLFVKSPKVVKVEVSTYLEDVFTDIFVGHIQDRQLKPNYLGGNLDKGIVAVFEEIEKRAQLKISQDDHSPLVKELDQEILSQGAGAKRKLVDKPVSKTSVKKLPEGKYQAGSTPEETWKKIIKRWKNKEKSPYLGIYTEMAKLMYRDYQNLPDSYYKKNVSAYNTKPYNVQLDGNFAVIDFGNQKGWDNSPFLMCKTEEGWKFDMVYQRKLVRMGPSPSWGVERTISPYTKLLRKYPGYLGIDTPRHSEDIYTIQDDKKHARAIVDLEEKLQSNPNSYEVNFELGKLYSTLAMGLKAIPHLNKAKHYNPDNPYIYKYLAIAYVDSTYQYKKAISEIKKYVELMPGDDFGYSFLGYLYFRTKKLDLAKAEFKKALKINPRSCYANAKLSRVYKKMYLDSSNANITKLVYKISSDEFFDKAKAYCTHDQSERFRWLSRWRNRKF